MTHLKVILCIALAAIAVYAMATNYGADNNSAPSPAFTAGYSIGFASGDYNPSDCNSAVFSFPASSASAQTEWIAGCKAGVADASK